MSKNEVGNQVRELRELRRMKEELEAQIESLSDSIKAVMTAENLDEISGTDWKATWKNVQSTRFDSKAFKADNPGLYSQYATTTITRRFSVA